MKYIQIILSVLTLVLMLCSILDGVFMQAGFQLMMGAAIVLLIQRRRDYEQFKHNQSGHD